MARRSHNAIDDRNSEAQVAWVDALPESPAWRQFMELVEFQPSSIPLDLGALLIAAQAQPALKIQAWLARLDAMGDQVRSRFPVNATSAEKLEVLTNYLTDVIGLRGNVASYYEPENSYLNRVIERSLGIPITISVLYLEVGRRCEMPLKGIGFPGHFLLKHCDSPEGYLDPFDPRRVLNTEDLEAMLERLTRGAVQLSPEHLEPTSNRDILTRMLANLKLVHTQRDEWARAVRMCDGILALAPGRAQEYRDRGEYHARLEFDGHAVADFEHYLAVMPYAPDAPAVRAQLEEARERLSHYH